MSSRATSSTASVRLGLLLDTPAGAEDSVGPDGVRAGAQWAGEDRRIDMGMAERGRGARADGANTAARADPAAAEVLRRIICWALKWLAAAMDFLPSRRSMSTG